MATRKLILKFLMMKGLLSNTTDSRTPMPKEMKKKMKNTIQSQGISWKSWLKTFRVIQLCKINLSKANLNWIKSKERTIYITTKIC